MAIMANGLASLTLFLDEGSSCFGPQLSWPSGEVPNNPKTLRTCVLILVFFTSTYMVHQQYGTAYNIEIKNKK